jgi:hypothetical protein
MKKRNRLSFITGLISVIMFFIPANMQAQTESSNPLPQFLFPSFSKGIIKMKDGRTMAAVLDYNMVDEEMVFQQNNLYLVLDKPEEVDTVFLRNRKFVPAEKVFYEVVASGKVTIFIQHKSRYSPVGTNSAYGLKTQTAGPATVQSVRGGGQYRKLDVPDDVTVSPATVYWARINGTMNKFQTEKQFLKLFPGSETKIREFIKTSGIDIKTPEGLSSLGKFCNELVK